MKESGKLYQYPFEAIVGQEKMKLALVLNVINPGLSGVLIRGEKGTAKSTAVRALAEILPEIEVIDGFAFPLDPATEYGTYVELCKHLGMEPEGRDELATRLRKTGVVELPVGATEDRVAGTLDLEHALKKGEKKVEPGLLARAHRGILYVDEVNLLDDHVVDILLDAAAMGVNSIEREGISFSHPARFTLVGTMNPEEGELRPQLLDRFGLCVTVSGIGSVEERVEVMKRRIAFEQDPEAFCARWQEASDRLAERIVRARAMLDSVTVGQDQLQEIAENCVRIGIDGHRGDIIVLKTAKTLAAWHGHTEVNSDHISTAMDLALPHRIRRQPLMDIPGSMDALLGSAAQ